MARRRPRYLFTLATTRLSRRARVALVLERARRAALVHLPPPVLA